MSQGAETRRLSGLPFIAGPTNIAAGNPVKLGTGSWTVENALHASDEPIGIARASAAAGKALDVRDTNDVIRGIAAATIAVGNLVGLASVFATGSTVVAQLAPVSAGVVKAPKENEEIVRTVVWSVGQAVEAANPGAEFGYRVNVRQISGLV